MTGMHTARESPIQNFAFLERPGREGALAASETGEEGFTGVTGKQKGSNVSDYFNITHGRKKANEKGGIPFFF